jgi:hypothetical protein
VAQYTVAEGGRLVILSGTVPEMVVCLKEER